MLKLAISCAYKGSSSFTKLRDQVKEIASGLEEKRTIPMVNDQFDLILDLQQGEYWADITLSMLEDVRKRLRDLVKFMDNKQRKLIYTRLRGSIGADRGWRLYCASICCKHCSVQEEGVGLPQGT